MYRNKIFGLALTAGLAVTMVSACGGGGGGNSISLGGSSATVASASGGQSSSGGHTAATSGKSSGGSGRSGVSLTACPSASVLSSAAGKSYQLLKNLSSAGYLTCSYNDSNQGALTIVASTLPAGTASPAVLKEVAQSQAQAQKSAGVTEVSGIGSAAFVFTEPSGVGSPNGVPASSLIALTGNQELVVGGDATPAQVEAIARAVLK